jgi:hypothetical protein
MAWSFKREESSGFDTNIPEGLHRIRIANAEKAKAKTGKDMLILTFDVSGYNGKIFHNIVFLPDRPEITNRNLTQFFDAFKDIQEGDFDTSHWIGKVGACQVKHEEYNGNVNAKVHYFINSEKQINLPAWREPAGNGATAVSNTIANLPTDADGFVEMPDGVTELPF